VQLRPNPRKPAIRGCDFDVAILSVLSGHAPASRIEAHYPHVDALEEFWPGQPHPLRRVPGDGRIQLGDQEQILNQLGARYHRSNEPEVNESAHEDLSDPRQSLPQCDCIAQPSTRTIPADTQGRGYFGDDVLMAVDGPVQPIDIVLRRASRVQLADSGQLSRAHHVLVVRRNGDRICHAGVIHINEGRGDLR
jgi:hypothetical protein